MTAWLRVWTGVAVCATACSMTAAGWAKPAEPGPGNSASAKSCQKGGWQTLTSSDGRSFDSQGECVSYAAQGGSFNRAPVAADDVNFVREDGVPDAVAGNVLANDSDADGDTLSVVSAGTYSLAYGTLVVNADGSYSYRLDNSDAAVEALNDGDRLTETFTYSISDGHGATATAKLTVTINGHTDNRVPVAADDVNFVREDGVPDAVAGNVLANDSDADGDTLSVVSAGTYSLAYGTLVVNADGSYSYRLDNSDAAVEALNDGDRLTETFTYSISDGHGATATAKLTVTINGHTDNRVPVAADDVNFVREDGVPDAVAGNVLANDSDADGDTLSVVSAGTYSLAYGTLVVNADGSYSYRLDNSDAAVEALNDGDRLTETFTYSISDGHGATATAKLTVTINGHTDNRVPVAADDVNFVREDGVPDAVAGNVLANDSDADGDTLSVVSAGTYSLAYGTLVVNADGSYSYRLDNSDAAVEALNDGDRLTETFTYSISDGHGATATAKLTVTINGHTD